MILFKLIFWKEEARKLNKINPTDSSNDCVLQILNDDDVNSLDELTYNNKFLRMQLLQKSMRQTAFVHH